MTLRNGNSFPLKLMTAFSAMIATRNVRRPTTSNRCRSALSALLSGYAREQHEGDHRHDDLEDEVPPPLEGGCDDSADQCGQRRATEAADRPETQRSLPIPVVVMGLDDRQARRENGGRRESLENAAEQHQRRARTRCHGRGQHDAGTADDGQAQPDPHEPDPAEPVGQATGDRDEDARHQRGGRHGEVEHSGVDGQRPLHVRDEVQGRLCEQPERQDREDDPEQLSIVTGVRDGARRADLCHSNPPRGRRRLTACAGSGTCDGDGNDLPVQRTPLRAGSGRRGRRRSGSARRPGSAVVPHVGATGNAEPADGLGLEPLPELDLASELLGATAGDTPPGDRNLSPTRAPGTGSGSLRPPVQARPGRKLACPAAALGTRRRIRVARDQPLEAVAAVAAVDEDRH